MPLSKKSSTSFTPLEITYVMLWTGALIFNFLGVTESIMAGNLAEYFSPIGNLDVVVGVLYLGVLSSVGGFFLFNYAIARLKVSQSAPLLNLTTVVSVLAGVIIQNDPFGGRVQ